LSICPTGQTDGRTPDRYFSITARRVQRYNITKVLPAERRDDMHPPMVVQRWQKSTSVHGHVCSPHISGGRRWLSCRQPACLQSGQLRRGTDRRTDRTIPKLPLEDVRVHVYCNWPLTPGLPRGKMSGYRCTGTNEVCLAAGKVKIIKPDGTTD